MDEQFLRTAMLRGEEAVEKLKKARVAVFGIGVWAAIQWRHWQEPVWARSM